MKYAVLGGGGSFGINTSLYLLSKGHEVIGIGRNPLPPEHFSLGIERHPSYKYVPLHIGHDSAMVLQFLNQERPQVIINYAAQGEGALSWTDSWMYFETNCVALTRLVEGLIGDRAEWLQRFIQIGTSEMYGSVTAPAAEDAPIQPTSPYAASKVAFDLYLQAIHKSHEFPMNIIRPSNCYCPGQRLHRIVPKTIVCGLLGKKVPLHGGGKAEKSYLHVRDLARAIYMLSVMGTEQSLGETFNIAPDDPTSIRDVVDLCARALGMRFYDLVEEVEERPGQDSKYWMNSEKANERLGWQQTIRWEHGIEEMVAWARRYLPQLEKEPMKYTVTP